VGRKFAEAGIQPVIDFSLRFNDMRPTNPIFVTKNKACELLETQESGSYVSPSVISNLIERQKYLCKAPITTTMEFANNIKSESGISVCGILSMDRRMKKTHNNFVISGSAVFRRDRLIGYMDEEETCGMEWIRGKVKIGDILIQNKDKSKISLNIVKAKSRFNPIINGKFISFTVNITAQSNIREIYENKSQNMDFNADPNLIDELSKKQNEVIGERINLAINAAQNRLGADVFGFGETIYRDYPKDWSNIKKRWDNIFPHINIKVNVSSQIKQTGDLSNVITDEEGS
jgi:spore germination protein KC